MSKFPASFYQHSALELAPKFLGKYLVRKTSKGIISGKIIDVEAYTAYGDDVSHGNKRTKRTEIMYQEGGFAYIYLIYGIHHQFAIVVNSKDIPEVVFIRAVLPKEGIILMQENLGREVKNTKDLTKSPGNLCKSFGINMSLYGESLQGDKIWIEDRGEEINAKEIIRTKRVGISKNRKGYESEYRFYIQH